MKTKKKMLGIRTGILQRQTKSVTGFEHATFGSLSEHATDPVFTAVRLENRSLNCSQSRIQSHSTI